MVGKKFCGNFLFSFSKIKQLHDELVIRVFLTQTTVLLYAKM